MALKDQATKRSGKKASSGGLASKARSRKGSNAKLDVPEPKPAKGPAPFVPPTPPPLPPALGFITSYARIPGLRKDKNTQQ